MTRPIVGQRFALPLPDGTLVTVTVTDEMVALLGRISYAQRQGVSPDLKDVLRLLDLTAEDS